MIKTVEYKVRGQYLTLHSDRVNNLMSKKQYVKYALLLLVSFTIVGCPPSPVTIHAPFDDEQFNVGEEITFTGSAMDSLEAELVGESLVWTSSIDGMIGTGTELTRNDLTEGTHEITLTATNSRGKTGRDTITIFISGGQLVGGLMTWSVDGTQYSSSPIMAYCIPFSTSYSEIHGFNEEEGWTISIIFNSELKVRTYVMVTGEAQGFFANAYTEEDCSLTSDGTVTVTSVTNERVTGTFEFTTHQCVTPPHIRNITNGYFDVPFASIISTQKLHNKNF
jgi:hypothetical protein